MRKFETKWYNRMSKDVFTAWNCRNSSCVMFSFIPMISSEVQTVSIFFCRIFCHKNNIFANEVRVYNVHVCHFAKASAKMSDNFFFYVSVVRFGWCHGLWFDLFIWITSHFSLHQEKQQTRKFATIKTWACCSLVRLVKFHSLRTTNTVKNDFIVYFPLGQTSRFLLTIFFVLFVLCGFCWPEPDQLALGEVNMLFEKQAIREHRETETKIYLFLCFFTIGR